MATSSEGITVVYVPCNPPHDLGWEKDYGGIMVHRLLYGHYRIEWPDGQVVLQPHSAIEGSTGAAPMPLDAEAFGGTTIREMIIADAIASRAATKAKT